MAAYTCENGYVAQHGIEGHVDFDLPDWLQELADLVDSAREAADQAQGLLSEAADHASSTFDDLTDFQTMLGSLL